MVVVKQLDPKYPRLGYEVQKGLIVDMPNGDGKAEIVENEDGSLTLSENEGKDTVTLKGVALSDFVDHDVRLVLKHGFEDNHVTNPRSQGCPRFQSGEELANSVGKINAYYSL